MDRTYLKNNAKFVLKKYYFVLLIVSLVVAVTGGSTSGIGHPGHGEIHGKVVNDNWYRGERVTRIGENTGISEFDGEENYFLDRGTDFINRGISGFPIGKIAGMFINMGFALVSFILMIGGLVFMFLISFPLHVGGTRIYIDSADGESAPTLGRFAFAFRSGHYTNILLAGFLRGLYTFLWSLLFIIPGIIKGYAYSMVPYILADNPEIKASDALRLSEQMMRGHKMELFILELSFVGWYLLGALAFGIGVFLVHPYKDATVAQFYLQLRRGCLAGPEEVIDTTAGGGYAAD